MKEANGRKKTLGSGLKKSEAEWFRAAILRDMGMQGGANAA
jgi:hypothetical protein